MHNGVDISKWNNLKDEHFEILKDAGYDFVIIRAGGNNGGFYTDPKYAAYYYAAHKAGLNVGAYYDTGRNFCESHIGYTCACHFNTLLQGKYFEMPVYFDIETVPTVYKKGATDAAISACQLMENLNFYVGIYASDISGFAERLELDRLLKYTLWVARYGKKPEYVKKYDMWQKSSKGSIEGIPGDIDLDTCYKDFPKVIKKKRLNGCR